MKQIPCKRRLSWAKKFVTVVLTVGGIAAAILAVNGVRDLIFLEKPEVYHHDWIPLVYNEIDEFRSFLKRNEGKVVKINSALALDDVLPESVLIHQVCEFEGPNGSEEKDFYSFGLPTFLEGFEKLNLGEAVCCNDSGSLAFPEEVYSKIRCSDSVRIELLDPSSFRWSYGGTGTRSLPLGGMFKITARHFSGPQTEYTLRQLEE